MSSAPTGLGSLGVGQSPKQVEHVGKEFESVFLSMMVKEMRKSIEGDGLFAGDESDTYGGMFDMFIGKHLAESQPLGIGNMLLQQYEKTSKALEASSAEATSVDRNA